MLNMPLTNIPHLVSQSHTFNKPTIKVDRSVDMGLHYSGSDNKAVLPPVLLCVY